jgi:Zn-dependent protease
MASLAEIGRIRNVRVYAHWSVLGISAFILLNAIKRPMISLIGSLCYWGVILLHETGHLIAAQRLGCRVHSIELYPIWGITRFQIPWSRFDHCVIAWGGVLAQAVIAVPLAAFIAIFGYTRIEAVNVVLALLGGISLLVTIFNLLPFPPLDGAMAWRIIPAYIERRRSRVKPMKANFRP